MNMLIDAYLAILHAAGLEAKGNSPVPQQEGEIYINRVESSEEKTLLLVNGKKLVLPVEYQLKNPTDVTWTTRILFHPFVEPALRGADDPVFIAIKDQLQMHANMCIMMQLYSLFAIAADKDVASTLNPEQSEVVSKLSGINEKIIKSFTNKIQKNLHVGKDIPYVRFYIKNTALLGGEKYSRGCIVSFPIYEELVKDTKNEIMSAAEKKVILEAFKYIFQNIDDINFYSQGSSCKIAPTIVALLMAYGNVALELNRITSLYAGSNVFECPVIPVEYDQYIASLSDASLLSEIRMIPHHANITSYKEVVAQQPQIVPFNQPQQFAQNQPQINQQFAASDPRRYMTATTMPNNVPWNQFAIQSNIPTWATQSQPQGGNFNNAFNGNGGFNNQAQVSRPGIYGF